MTRFIGLTGGIATGKSTVSHMLVALGAKLIDADVVAREVVAPGQPALKEIAARFDGVVGPDGTLDRKKLGARVFASETDRAALNAITHPRIQARVVDLAQSYAASGAPVVVYDAALLFENGLERALEGVILVTAPAEVQLHRLMTRDGLSREAAQARIDAQMPLHEKKKLATWQIDNGGSKESTSAQVTSLWKTLAP